MDYVCYDAERVGPWVAAQGEWEWVAGRGEAVGLVREGQIIAGAVFEDFRGSNCTAHIAGNPASGWMKNRNFLQALKNYIDGLGCIRLTAPVPVSDEKLALQLTRAGWQIEAVLRQAHYGVDLLLFVLWLDKPNILTRLEDHGRRRRGPQN